MWNNKTVSVVIPAHTEEETVRTIIEKVYGCVPVDEVLVVNNASTDRTGEEVKKTRAKLTFEGRKGYGFAVQKGFREAMGDLVVLFDADGNFPAKDILKLLAYADDFDLVKGTRSRRELIEKGVYPPFISWLVMTANIAVAKFQQFVFRGPALTDNCSLRLIKKSALKKILPQISVGGPCFLTDMTDLAMLANLSIIEIPVRFTKRIGGRSKYSTFGLMKVAVKMVLHIMKQRVLGWFGHYKFD